MRLGGRLSAAIDILSDIETRRRPVADALKDWGLSHRFAGSGDRAAIGNIVYDALRRKRSFAFRIEDDGARALAVAAVLDGFAMEPDDLARALEGDRFAPDLPSADAFAAWRTRDLAVAPDAVRADVPDWLAESLAYAFGEDWIAEAAALSDRPPLDLRVNTLAADRAKALKALAPFKAEATALSPTGVRIAPIARDGRHPNVQVEAGFQKGWFEIQDEGSQIAALLAGARPGEQVLDLCAGAGGKTLALSAAMENTGQIHATDSDRQRLAPIHERLKRAGARNVQVHDPRDDLSDLQGRMDLVLVDAPCTGTGTWRRRPDAKWRLSEAALARRVEEQDAVLDEARRFVKPGGRLAYITCSVLTEENAARIAAFLGREGGSGFGVRDAEARWQALVPQEEAGRRRLVPLEGGGQAIALTPLLSGTDGFFFAMLERR
ncbi:RsmB/NOP family class I SAM-dependent RNA methyltransferase [Aurantimonas sp. VKM B-3413]|uniref:RsmB/NOP family class I SAM-dependent RNA methyltransferase n=1 Tax=Aurantimonas sp. VKM B-3413 TaxID=2779401 RepID=UPI001E30A53B|nr:RsmB/NOP family class I SAM-dependent RNA methyltransferase [Aurantimonas sp. VKM B-3413]MCB8839991.1 RsmB/NOP family class I SAM-dependent RNA methyltransferase [Aurantimonas sp. VKM B-3413]